MIEKGSGLFTLLLLLLLLLFPLARLFIHSFPSFILSNSPLFCFSSLSSVTCPTMRSFHLRLHPMYIHHTTQKGLWRKYIRTALYLTCTPVSP